MSSAVPAPVVDPEEEERKWLENCISTVKHHAFYMKRSLDNADLNEALSHASLMLNEMRTSVLTPKNYYELYMCVFDELHELEMFFIDDYAKKPQAFHRLYESVQHCGNIVPRLYLLITVGSAYISVKPDCARDILEDMIEMCKGVQHPTRGLFLRFYLTQLCKNKLPDAKEKDEINSYSLQWVLQNFIEMNRLWVRLQSKMLGGKKREQERMDLRILVGANLVRLSQLECVSLDVYKSEILPKVLKEIIECKDRIAQQYLIDVIIQVFPDEFHLETLSQVLMATREFGFGVDIRSMLVGFMERLANFATGAMGSKELELPRRKEIIQVFFDEIKHQMRVSMQAHFILEGEILPMMSLEDLLTTVVGLSTMALRLDPASTETMDNILKMTLDGLSVAAKDVLEERNVIRGLQRLLHIPIDEYKNTIKVLSLNNIPDGCTYLTPPERRRLALDFLRSALDYGDLLSTPEHVERFFLMIEPLVVDPTTGPGSGKVEEKEKESGVLSYRPEKEEVGNTEDEFDEEEFAEEQNLVSQIVHLISLENVDLHFKLLGGVRKMFAKGGPRRLLFTLPSLAMGFLRLISAVGRRQKAGETIETPLAKIYKFALDTIHVLRSHRAEIALKIYLEGALVADVMDDEDHTYEFLSRAFVIYEEDIADSKLQYHCLQLFMNTMCSLRNMSSDSYDTLCTRTTKYSMNLLKKVDQGRAVCQASVLFWSERQKNENRVLECLQKSIRLADKLMTVEQVPLLVDILNYYLLHYGHHIDKVEAKYIAGLIDLIRSSLPQLEDLSDDESMKYVPIYFQNALTYLSEKAEIDPKFGEIDLTPK